MVPPLGDEPALLLEPAVGALPPLESPTSSPSSSFEAAASFRLGEVSPFPELAPSLAVLSSLAVNFAPLQATAAEDIITSQAQT
jgi:hypothetical protein